MMSEKRWRGRRIVVVLVMLAGVALVAPWRAGAQRQADAQTAARDAEAQTAATQDAEAQTAATRDSAQLEPGTMDVQWNEGAADCTKTSLPPLQVHRYNAQTYILRESLCSTFEAPFMYLLIGSRRAMLIDTGDVADAAQMPLATTVMSLLPMSGLAKLRLLVVHTHRHLDHRAGDGQFTGLADVEVVGYDIASVRKFYQFDNWKDGIAEIDLGGRIVEAMATPGHNETEVSFYDRNTGLFFSGDFMMPARLLIDDPSADMDSAEKVAAFVRDRPVSYVLGGHIEMDAKGNLFPWESRYHPNEHVLQMTKEDLLALPGALRGFNGFYNVVQTKNGPFVMIDSMRILMIFGAGVILALVLIVWVIAWFVRRGKRKRMMRRMA